MEPVPEKYRLDLVIINATAEQIIRDLGIDDFKIIFSGNPSLAFNEIKSQLRPVVLKIFNENRQAFQSLLYRVDIPEAEYKNVLSHAQTNAFDDEIAEMIIRREFQKVLLRKYFSAG